MKKYNFNDNDVFIARDYTYCISKNLNDSWVRN